MLDKINKKLYILGSSGFATEVAQLAKNVGWSVESFIDIQKKDSVLVGDSSIPVIDEESFIRQSSKSQDSDYLAIGVGSPVLIKALVERFKGYRFPNLIHPRATIDLSHVALGVGNIITANTVFTTNIKIGSFNIFNLSTTVGHDVRIGDGNVINPLVAISGDVSIASYNLFGVSSTILQGLSIGNGNIIGASALLTKKVDDNSLMVGIPAKEIIKS